MANKFYPAYIILWYALFYLLFSFGEGHFIDLIAMSAKERIGFVLASVSFLAFVIMIIGLTLDKRSFQSHDLYIFFHKKFAFNTSLVTLSSIGIIYLVCTFIEMTPNFMEWSRGTRVLVPTIPLIMFSFSCIYHSFFIDLIFDENNK